MNKCITLCVLLNFLASVSILNAQETNWVDLFDGKTISGWHEYLTGQPIGWKVSNGTLFTSGGNEDIVTDNNYTDFELEVEWKIEEGGNSGIFYHVQEEAKYPRMYETGPEFQIIDDDNYSIELLEKQKTGSCSDVIPPNRLKFNPPGVWNRTTIKVNNGLVQHWLNGYKILEFNMDTKEWQNKVSESKFKDLDYAKIRGGKIGLQDHGKPVYYRKIRIIEIN